MERVGVIIPYYNGADWIRPCVESVLAGPYPVEKILLVDNSTGETGVERLLSGLAGVEIIRTAPAIGFGRACNVGLEWCRRAGLNVGILLNQDAVMGAGCVTYLVEALQAEEKLLATVPISLQWDMQQISVPTFRKYILPLEPYLRDLVSGQLAPFYPLQPKQANASCVAFRLAWLERIGTFDPFFPMYGEETELFARAIHRHGLQIGLAPKARIGHAHTNFTAKGEAQFRTHLLVRQAFQRYQLMDPGASLGRSLFAAIKYTINTYLKALLTGQRRKIGNYLARDLALCRQFREIIRGRNPDYQLARIRKQLEADLSTITAVP